MWINFMYAPNGMQEEFERIKAAQKLLIELNGCDERAINLRYENLEKCKKELYNRLETDMLIILLKERALSELYDELILPKLQKDRQI